MTSDTKTYVFADETTGGHGHAELVDHLGGIFDRFTCRRLAEAGVSTGASCLEVGAGSGSVALWLAETVGPHGEVVATDNDTQVVANLPSHPQLRTRLHDITSEPVDGLFDLVHARAVLVHLPQREQVLAKLAGALGPGGVLVVEEFAPEGWRNSVLDAADVGEATRLLETYQETLVRLMEGTGSDASWGRRVSRTMREVGLVDVDTELGGAVSWRGGTAGCLLPHTMIAQMRPALQGAGISAADLDALRGLLLDPKLVILNSLMISTIGRKPTS